MRRLLLDTHVVLWWQGNSKELNDSVRAAIHAANEVYVSAASAWEAEIKRALGKLDFPESFIDVLEPNGFHELPVTMRYAGMTAMLAKHHRDPFDRILLAQAMAEDCTLVTADRELARYGVKVMYAGR